jgi:hypothetical protein
VDDCAMDEGQLYVFWAINGYPTTGMVRRGAQLDMVAILEAMAESGGPYEAVHAAGSFPMVDAYGNAREQVVVSMMYNKATIERVNWDGFLSDNINEIADEEYLLHPEFRP